MTGHARVLWTDSKITIIEVQKDPVAVAAGGLDSETFTIAKPGSYRCYSVGKLSTGIAAANAPNLTASFEKSVGDGGGNFVPGDNITGVAVILQNNDVGARTFGASGIIIISN